MSAPVVSARRLGEVAPLVLAVCRRRRGWDPDVEDIAQETLAGIGRALADPARDLATAPVEALRAYAVSCAEYRACAPATRSAPPRSAACPRWARPCWN